MQLGTRWTVWQPAPAGLPEVVIAAIGRVESDLIALATQHPDLGIDSWRWTLTWLEGRPVVELDDGTTIRIDAAGFVTVSEESDA